MAKLEFQDLSFEEQENHVKVYFLDNFYFLLDKKDLDNIGKFSVGKSYIEFDYRRADRKFNFLINDGFENLRSVFTDKKAVYIHQNMDVPLIGLNYFGIVDRNTNLIEVKPLTGCNFNCVYCSIDEGISSTKQTDFVIEKDFMVQEVRKLIDSKDCDKIEIYINPHGEPLLYKPLVDLVKDLSAIDKVSRISISSNAELLDKKKVDDLISAGLTKFNLSVNALDEKIASKMAGKKHNSKSILEICKYIASKGAGLFIAPVWLPGYNDEEMPKLIEFAKELDAKMCIQNFLNYKFGRNPAKQMPFDEFFDKLKKLEKKHDVRLIVNADDFEVVNTNKLKKPFKKNDSVEAEILFDGRLKGEKIAMAQDRLISIPDCSKTGKVRLKIVRSKHNIFVGVLA